MHNKMLVIDLIRPTFTLDMGWNTKNPVFQFVLISNVRNEPSVSFGTSPEDINIHLKFSQIYANSFSWSRLLEVFFI